MNVAIYSRKSKFNDKSESIDSQITFCKTYINSKYSNEEIKYFIYTDEGFSGSGVHRPEYQKLLSDLKTKKINIIVSYKIDRLSRSFIDFANLQQLLEKQNIHIISASEGFDTSTPWGKSVLNILMVFAELERNNVSQRIRDTMLHYAKQGRFTGGILPTGFKSKEVIYTDNLGKQKKMKILEEIPEEIKTVKTIYKKYLELKNLSSLSSWLLKNSVKTKKENNFSPAVIRDILRNPVYAVADIKLYNYFSVQESNICNPPEEFDGNFSVIPYNRTDKHTFKERPKKDWIIAISNHKGIIPSESWILVQKILSEKSIIIPRLGTAEEGIFSGIIKCSVCKSNMRIKKGRINKKSNLPEFYYVCTKKEKTHSSGCNVKNITGTKLEKAFFDFFEQLVPSYSKIIINKKDIEIPYEASDNYLKTLNSKLNEKRKELSNLLIQLSKTSDTVAGSYITEHINRIDTEIKNIQKETELLSCQNKNPLTQNKLKDILHKLNSPSALNLISSVSVKRSLIRSIISFAEWDGENLYINFADV